MLHILIVDDEVISLQGLVQSMDWKDLGIKDVYQAYDVESAKEQMKNNSIQLIICDIEMPGGSGLDFVQWVKLHYPETLTIFLTGHPNFSYAQQAIQLGSYDYLLKPISYDDLKEVLRHAIEELEKQRASSKFQEMYATYYKLWENHIPFIRERFWQDVINDKIDLSYRQLMRTYQEYNLPLTQNNKILPLVISVEHWSEELNSLDEQIMGYALKNTAEELILKGENGQVIQDRNGVIIILIYLHHKSSLLEQELILRAETYIKQCNKYFSCSISVYVGMDVYIHDLSKQYLLLLGLERSNVTQTNSVKLLKNDTAEPRSTTVLPSFDDWAILFEMGKTVELIEKITDCIDRLERDSNCNYETIAAFYYGFLHMLYQVLHKHDLTISQVYQQEDIKSKDSVTKSLILFKDWLIHVVKKGSTTLEERSTKDSSIIGKIKLYIQEHIDQQLTREEIAAHVFLNAAYLSRLFKKETGYSLSEWIMDVRIQKVKHLLTETNQKISCIAEEVGINNLSKVFKRETGVSPQEFRAQYQNYRK